MDSFGFLFIEPEPDQALPSIGHVYVRSDQPLRPGRHRGTRVLTGQNTSWSEFEQELDRLQCELEEIRREAQLRFAGSTAKRYGTTSALLRVLRGKH